MKKTVTVIDRFDCTMRSWFFTRLWMLIYLSAVSQVCYFKFIFWEQWFKWIVYLWFVFLPFCLRLMMVRLFIILFSWFLTRCNNELNVRVFRIVVIFKDFGIWDVIRHVENSSQCFFLDHFQIFYFIWTL